MIDQNGNRKDVRDLSVRDFEKWPVWRHDWSDEAKFGDSTVLPVKGALPLSDVDEPRACIFGLKITLANGLHVWASLTNVRISNSPATTEFLSASFFNDCAVYRLARYFDPWYDTAGPQQLADFLGLAVTEVFPISYDLTTLIVAEESALRGQILAEPVIRRTSSERAALRKT